MLKRIKIGNNEREVIKFIGLGAIILVALTSPSPKLSAALVKLLKEKGSGYFSKMLNNLKNKNVIILGGEKVRLTRKGRELLNLIELQNFQILKPKKWDGIWRLVSYDIPNVSKKKRDWFRQTLKVLEFQKIQESLWVHPYECKEEIAVIAKDLGVAKYVIMMTTDYLPNQDAMLKRFNL